MAVLFCVIIRIDHLSVRVHMTFYQIRIILVLCFCGLHTDICMQSTGIMTGVKLSHGTLIILLEV